MVLLSAAGEAEGTTEYLNSVGLPPLLTAAMEALGEEMGRRHVRDPLRVIAQHLKDNHPRLVAERAALATECVDGLARESARAGI